MNNQNNINPYRQNSAVLRTFFASPLILIIAITYALCAFTGLISGFFGSSSNISLGIDVYSVLSSIAFFLLYFTARRPAPTVSFKAPIVLLRICAIFFLVFASAAIIFFMFIAFAFLLAPQSFGSIHLLIPLLLIIFPAIIFLFMLSIGMLVFISSIKNSVNSVFLYNKGACFTGVMSLLIAVASIIIFLFCATSLPGIISRLNLSIAQTLNSFGAAPSQSGYFINTFSISLIAIINSALKTISFILFAVFAFLYARYIKKMNTSLNMRANAADNASANVPPATVNVAPNHVGADNFQPLNVFNNNTAHDESPLNTPMTNNNPYINNQTHTAPTNAENKVEAVSFNEDTYITQHTIVCQNCGNVCFGGMAFCGKCGAPLE